MIKIDDRENKEFQAICNIFFNECEVDHLLVGDIVVNELVCFEHKQPADFISSIYDGRLFSQIEKMKANYSYFYIIVSGSYTDITSNPSVGNVNSVTAAISSCFARGCPVIFCDNYQNVCVLVTTISKKLLDNKDRSISIVKIPIEHDQLRLICSISGISESKGQLLLDRFKTPINIFNANKSELTEINGIGDKIADKIFNIIHGNDNHDEKF